MSGGAASTEAGVKPAADEYSGEYAIFGGGCFWCLEAVFEALAGVEEVESGYCGGHVADPSYEQVCGGDTGHAEVVRLRYDPRRISYRQLLEVFFATHDPTTPNRQGHDVGTQYRSVIFAQTAEQAAAAAAMIAELDEARAHAAPHSAPIVTQIVAPGAAGAQFWPAEAYHQDYFARNSGAPYCQVVVAPKLAKLRGSFAARLKQPA